MIKTTGMLIDELKSYKNPRSKLSRMVRDGQLIPIIRGLYSTDRDIPPEFLAPMILGPSYISFEWALAHYGLIPEAVKSVTCASFRKRKTKRFETPFGDFVYRDVPQEAFPYGLTMLREGGYWCRIARPEKAVCDQIHNMPPASNQKELLALLLDFYRIDEDGLRDLDPGFIDELGSKYHSTNVRMLGGLLRRLQRWT